MNIFKIIKEYNINQIFFCPTIKKKIQIDIKKKTKLKDYKDKIKPVIFYGCNNENIKKLIKKHQGILVIIWNNFTKILHYLYLHALKLLK